MAEHSWLTDFPAMDRSDLVAIRKTLDGAYRNFSREYGDMIEGFFDPLLSFLIWFEKLLLASPWWAVLLVITALVYLATRSALMSGATVIAFLLIGYFGAEVVKPHMPEGTQFGAFSFVCAGIGLLTGW